MKRILKVYENTFRGSNYNFLFTCLFIGLNCSGSFYTPGIYAAGYIVFALTFVRSSVRMFVRSFVRSCVRSFVTFRHVRRIYLKVFG